MAVSGTTLITFELFLLKKALVVLKKQQESNRAKNCLTDMPSHHNTWSG